LLGWLGDDIGERAVAHHGDGERAADGLSSALVLFLPGRAPAPVTASTGLAYEMTMITPASRQMSRALVSKDVEGGRAVSKDARGGRVGRADWLPAR
jgi:hypothetical protein